MWPFKSKIPSLTSISQIGDSFTFTHASGVYNFNKADIVKTSYSSDFFSKEKEYDDNKSSSRHFLTRVLKENFFFRNQYFFKTANTFWFFLLYGGMLNMITSFFPINSFYVKEKEIINISGDFFIAHKIILVISAFILTYLLFAFSIFLLKRQRINLNKDYYEEDILSIWTNNQYIKIRINRRNDPFLYFNSKNESIEPKHWFQDNKKVWIPTLLILFVALIFTNYKTPFWFYNIDIVENVLSSLFKTDKPFQYWAYYSEYQLNGSNSWSISHNLNPFIAFYDGMVSNFLLVISIPFLYLLLGVSLTAATLFLLIVFGPMIMSFELFSRMVGDAREIYKIYKKYGKFVILAWIVLFFELYYFHHIVLIWFISLSLFALILEVFRIKAIKKIGGNTEFYFSISKYNKERGQEIYPQLFMALYIPILLAFILLFIPFSVLGTPNHPSAVFGVPVVFIIIILFAPLGFITWLRFYSEQIYPPSYKKSFRNRKDLKSWVYDKVARNGLTLEFASEELRNDKEIVLKAVQNRGSALQYASDELKNDREIVLEAIKFDKEAIQYASEEMKNDPEIVEALKGENEK